MSESRYEAAGIKSDRVTRCRQTSHPIHRQDRERALTAKACNVRNPATELRLQDWRRTVSNLVAVSDAAHPERALASTNAVPLPRFVRLQSLTGRVRFRNLHLKPL